jgi:hypothetical protein
MPRKTSASSSAAPRRRAKPVADTANNHAPPAQPSTPVLDAGPTPGEIAEAAYHRYLQRGGQHGSDFDDWIQAERELRERSGSNPKSQ